MAVNTNIVGNPVESLDIDIKNLKISTLNVRGLKNNIKQNTILQTLRESNADIIALQETHLSIFEFKRIESKWNGPCFFSESHPSIH